MKPFLLALALLFSLQGFAQKKTKAPEHEPLKDSVEKYEKQRQYKKVLPFAEQWAEKLKKDKKESSAEYGVALNSLGNALNQTGKSKEAEPILLQALEIRKKALGPEHPEVGGSLHNLGVLYFNMGNYTKAEPYYLQALEIRKKALGPENPNVGSSFNSLGNLYIKMGDYAKAELYLLQALEIRKKNLGPEHPDVGASLNNLGNLYYFMGDYAKVVPYFLQALEIRKKALGPEHPDVGQSLNNLGHLYMSMGDYAKAEPFHLQALEIRKKALDPKHPDVGASLNNLGILYWNMGNCPKAETYNLQALEIRKKALGPEHPDVGSSFNNLGILYKDMGDYDEAESNYLKALENWKKALGPEHSEVAGALNNLGGVYNNMGNYANAELYYLQALEILKKAVGPDHPDVAMTLNNLGVLYMDMENFAKANTYYKQALEIRKKVLGPEHPKTAGSLNNLGNLYMNMGDYAKAEPNYLQAMEIGKKAQGPEHPEVASSINNLGNLYEYMGDYAKAEPYKLQALEIRKKAYGPEHPEVASTLNSLGVLYLGVRNYPKAEGFYLNWKTNKQNQIQRYFPFLSDNEKAKFYDSKLSGAQANFLSFCVERYPSQKAIAGALYNDQLATKGLLLNSATKWIHRIRNSKDTALSKQFKDWEILTNKIAKSLSSTDSAELAQLKTLQDQAEKLEKELVKKSEDFATLADKTTYTWKDVQAKLKPGEAAIEVVRVRKYGIDKVVTDTSDPKKPTYHVKGLTDTIHYAAYIVRPNCTYPEMVLLTNGNDLEGRWLAGYKNSMRSRIEDRNSYQQFWKKIGEKLGPAVKRVYFAPDGIYNSINLNTLKNPKTGKYLLDELDIRILTNTKELITASTQKPNADYACLVGFPEYNADKDKRMEVASRERNLVNNPYYLNLTRSDGFAQLPGTKTEVENISTLMQSKGWKVETLTGEKALEENIKALQMPRVLHIATHGFFEPGDKKGNPLVKSGLLLTGANKTLQGEKALDIEDGVLTALEAMNLNLDNTDLVVLSACETGLGEIKNGEGVYGLQRAFKVAGAKSIIMSLWKVNDQTTQELMVSFYRYWLENRTDSSKLSIRSKRQAFLAAQKELKAKYPHPYFWGAFVMVGE